MTGLELMNCFSEHFITLMTYLDNRKLQSSSKTVVLITCNPDARGLLK